MALTSNDTPTQTPPTDEWLRGFKYLREMQVDHGWEDFLLPTNKAMKAIELLQLCIAPFQVCNGLTGNDCMWLWLSPSAARHVDDCDAHILGDAITVKRGYYLVWHGYEELPPAQDAIRVLDWDMEAAVLNAQRTRTTGRMAA